MAHNAVYDYCLPQMGQGNIVWVTSNTTNWCSLLGNTAPTKTTTQYTTSPAFTGELTSSGNYVVGGSQVAPTTPTVSSAVTKFAAASNTVFGSNDQTYTAYYTTLHAGALKTTTGPLICYHDFGGGQAVSSGTFTLAWSNNGVFTLTSSAEA